MRVIAGSAGGLHLTVPKSVTRPTADRVREALFSSLGDRVTGAKVLDLYAGSGALGIEALSRGAASVVFVEAEERACGTVRTNLERVRLAGLGAETRRARVSDYLNRLEEADRFDLIFADPPYARDAESTAEVAALLASIPLARALREGGLFVLESLKGTALPLAPHWRTLRERTYGGTSLHFLETSRNDSAA